MLTGKKTIMNLNNDLTPHALLYTLIYIIFMCGFIHALLDYPHLLFKVTFVNTNAWLLSLSLNCVAYGESSKEVELCYVLSALFSISFIISWVYLSMTYDETEQVELQPLVTESST